MRDVLVLRRLLATVWVVICLVTTQILRFLCRRLRTLYYDRLQSISQQLHVMTVGPSHYHGDGDTITLRQ